MSMMDEIMVARIDKANKAKRVAIEKLVEPLFNALDVIEAFGKSDASEREQEVAKEYPDMSSKLHEWVDRLTKEHTEEALKYWDWEHCE